MRLIAASLLLLLGACSKEGPPPLDIAQSKQMIWDAIKLYHDASDKDEIGIIKTLLAPEVSLVVAGNDVIRGQDNVIRALTDRMKSVEGKSRVTITGKEVISVTGDMALVTYLANVGNERGIITVVCRRNKDNKWLIAHIHDTLSITSPKK